MSAPRNSRQVGNIREYTWRGQSVPSVTSILSAIDKPALRTWYAKMTAAAALEFMDKAARQKLLDAATAAHEATKTHQDRHQRVCDFVPDALAYLAGAPTRIRDTAGARGTAVHEAAEVDADLSDVPENAKAAYGSYRQWVEDFQPVILARECQVFNDIIGYAGSLDLIAQLPWIDPESTWLIDIKSSKSIYHETRLQLRGYYDSPLVINGDEIDRAATGHLLNVNRFAILHVTDEGYEFVEVEAGDEEADVFNSALTILNWLRANDRQPVGTIIPRPTEAAA